MMSRDSMKVVENATAEKTPENMETKVDESKKSTSAACLRNPEEPESVEKNVFNDDIKGDFEESKDAGKSSE